MLHEGCPVWEDDKEVFNDKNNTMANYDMDCRDHDGLGQNILMQRYLWPLIKSVSLGSVRVLSKAILRTFSLRYGEQLPLFIDFDQNDQTELDEEDSSLPLAL